MSVVDWCIVGLLLALCITVAVLVVWVLIEEIRKR